MTQPDRLSPDGTANKGSFAAFAAKTQEQWQEEQRGKTASSLNNAKAGFGKIGDDIRTILSSIIRGWSGQGESDWDFSDLFDTSASQKREQTQIAAGLAQLQADVAANNNSGKTFQVAMEDHGTSIPTVFTKFYDLGDGAVYNDGDTIQMSNSDGMEAFKYHPAPLLTDYFEVSLIVPKQAGHTFGNYVDRALFFIGRADAAFENFCVARLNGNKLRIGAVIDGVSTITSPTWFGSGPSGAGPTEITITPGVYMTFGGGTLAGSKVFQFKINNQVKATFADSSDVSLIGEDYRWVGLGIRNDNDAINQSPSVSHFMANDNAAAEVVGSGATLVRLSTTSTAISSGTNELATDFWDSVEEVSDDLLDRVDVSAGTVTVPVSDWYTITAQIQCGSSWTSHFQFVLYKDNLPYKKFGHDVMFGSNALGGTIIPDAVGATWTGYLYAEDVVSIGYDSDGSALTALRGSTDGLETYFTLRRGKA